MNFKNKIFALAASVALGIGLGLVAALPAEAVYGNSVKNFSTGWVLVERDSGQRVWLAGYGAYTTNVNWVVVTNGSCVAIGTKKYCAYNGSYSVRLGLAQYSVKRIS